ncbi:MAG: PD40 domain-containing protein, partial [Proteobacteria bacterium]|nr:PD40 domain-containing protein [Pseudomonadota bacterium]
MKTKISSYILIIVSLIFTACGEHQAPVVAGQAASEPAVQGIPKYSAEDFFETTSFSLVGSAAHAFSADGSSLLISSDSTGVFNAYALPLDGGPLEQLTKSEDNAVFAVSWFPKDKRILYTYDSGGNELNHVIVREEDGSSHDLTPGDALKAGFLKWSDDGESFYLTSTERNQQAFDIYR